MIFFSEENSFSEDHSAVSIGDFTREALMSWAPFELVLQEMNDRFSPIEKTNFSLLFLVNVILSKDM